MKAAQSLETQARILKSALKLFNERGTRAVTTHDIAAAADLSPGNLYYHFCPEVRRSFSGDIVDLTTHTRAISQVAYISGKGTAYLI